MPMGCAHTYFISWVSEEQARYVILNSVSNIPEVGRIISGVILEWNMPFMIQFVLSCV